MKDRSWDDSNVPGSTLLGTYALGRIQTVDGERWFVMRATDDYAEPDDADLFVTKLEAWCVAQLRETDELGPSLVVVRELVASRVLVRR